MGEESSSPFPWMTVVGIVGDVKHTSLEADAAPEMYRPFAHNQDWNNTMTFAVRTAQKPDALIQAIRHEIQTLDADQPIARINTMSQLLDRSVAKRRFNLLLMGIFAITAVLLAAVGLYGLISYLVTQNRREIGIRIALGAQRSDVLILMVGQGLVLSLIGTAIGLAGASALTRLITSFLFGVTPTDPATFIVVSAGLIGIALLACYIPARRATKVDPMVVLRYE
jgi:putative ABC transport system permease protein